MVDTWNAAYAPVVHAVVATAAPATTAGQSTPTVAAHTPAEPTAVVAPTTMPTPAVIKVLKISPSLIARTATSCSDPSQHRPWATG
jgi:hypothetical protein